MLLVSTDSSISGGIRKFCEVLRQHIDFEDYIVINKVQGEAGTFIKSTGKAPLLIFNFFKLIRLAWGMTGSAIVLNDPQFSTVSLVTLLVAKLRRKKVIFVSHGFLFHNRSDSLLKKLYFKFLCLTFFKLMKIVTVSTNDTERCKLFGFNNYQEILHGIKPTKPLEKTITLLAIGRNVPHKRLDLFVRLCEQLSINYSGQLQFALVTDDAALGANVKGLQVYTSISDQDLEQLLAQAEFIVSFSEYEGFGLSVLEGVAAGAIPVVYGNNSFLEIFHETPQLIFKSGVVEEAFDIIESVRDKSSDNNLKASLEKICNRYSVDAMIEKYRSVIEVSQ